MPISRKHKAIFVHIPKTGGYSITKALNIKEIPKNLFGLLEGKASTDLNKTPCTILQHLTINEIKKLHPYIFKNYFKFSFVRNPYSRLVSVYEYQKSLGPDHFLFSKKMTFNDFVNNLYNKYKNLFLGNLEVSQNGYCHYMPQSYYIICDSGISLDFIGYFENFISDLTYVLAKLKIDIENIPYINKGEYDNTRWMEYYNDELTEKVYQMYKLDFELFYYNKTLIS